jgi:hypothetical protein
VLGVDLEAAALRPCARERRVGVLQQLVGALVVVEHGEADACVDVQRDPVGASRRH